MKRDLFAAFKPKGTISKNDFDLTQKHVFSSRPGIIQPVCSIPVVPADYHEIDLTGMIRTMTMNTAAFVRGTWNFEAVFVPYTQLWHPFAQFITQRNDKHSSTQKGTAFCPVVSLKGLLIYIRQSLAFYEYHFWITHNQSVDSMLTAMPYVCDVHGYSWAHGALRLLDMLGYGDYSWIYQPSQEFENPSETNHHVVVAGSFNAYLERMQDKYVNVFALAAYQHSWYDLFRNKFYDEQTNINSQGVGNQSYVDFFNFDDIDCRAFSSSIICAQLLSNIDTDTIFSSLFTTSSTEDDSYRIKGLLEIRYHQWKRDRFTSAMPSAQFGDVAKYENTAFGPIYNSIVPTSQSQTAVGSSTSSFGSGGLGIAGIASSNNWKVTSVIDVVALRKAELLQQWKMNALRAGNMTDDAMQAHYGVTPYYTSDENVRHLGGWSTLLKVEPVTSTAATGMDNGEVGDLAAKGLSSDWQGSKVKCESRDFGCIQIYAYFLPEAEYAAEMIDKEHMRHEEFDFFTKELENIGLQPEMAISLSDNILIPSGSSENDPLLATIGFNPPNVDLKTSVDKVHAGFYDKRIVLQNLGNVEIQKAGTLSAWVAPKPTNFYKLLVAQGVLRPSLRNFYVNPNIFDKVMSNDMQSSNDYDNFVCNVLVVDHADRNLTVLGLPQY